MTPEQKIYMAARARDVLENEAYQKAFDDIRQEFTETWKNSPVDADAERETLYLMIRLTNKLQASLVGMLEDGKMAKIQQEHESNRLAAQRAAGISIG